ncbi:MAG: hypothetical protein WCR49_10885, partial [Opitutae bacterium]
MNRLAAIPRLTSCSLTLALIFPFAYSSATATVTPALLRGDASAQTASLSAAAPLDRLTVLAPTDSTVEVKDGAGHTYYESKSAGAVSFTVGGGLGERYALRPLGTRATAVPEGFSLDGRKVLVWHAAGSQALIVSAMLDGEMALFVVATDAKGVKIADYP